jgi:hypothetical protein
MDVARSLLAIIFAAAYAPLALPATRDWSSAGTVTAPTISASPPAYDRYAYPPNAPRPAAAAPATISERAQNAFTETANTLRDGIQAGVRAASEQLAPSGSNNAPEFNQQFQNWTNSAAHQLQSAGNSVRSAADQAFGTSARPSQSTNPFAPPAPAKPVARGGVSPPPWPTTSSTTTTTTTAPSWPNTPRQAAPGERTAFPSSTAAQPQTSSPWTRIDSNVAAPPLAVPELTTTKNNFAPAANTAAGSRPAPPPENYRGQSSIHSPLVTSPQQPDASATVRSTTAADTWPAGSSTTNDASRATIGIGTSNTAPSQPAATTTQDTKKTGDGKPTDFWADDSWTRPPQSASTATIGPASTPAAPSATIKSATVAAAANVPPTNQSSATSPVLNPPAAGPAGLNAAPTNSAPTGTQAITDSASAKPNQPSLPPNSEKHPWVPLLAAILSLAGSLAANFFLGWSYLDTRQKYQSLVRRTADTFRRAKPAAA